MDDVCSKMLLWLDIKICWFFMPWLQFKIYKIFLWTKNLCNCQFLRKSTTDIAILTNLFERIWESIEVYCAFVSGGKLDKVYHDSFFARICLQSWLLQLLVNIHSFKPCWNFATQPTHSLFWLDKVYLFLFSVEFAKKRTHQLISGLDLTFLHNSFNQGRRKVRKSEGSPDT